MAVAVAIGLSGTPAAGSAPSRSAAAPPGLTFLRTAYPIRELPPSAWPYVRSEAGPLEGGGTYDATGVAVRVINGRAYDHPVIQAEYILRLLSSYAHNRDERYLARARVNAARLIDRAVASRGALYLPYPFNFPLHGDEADMMVAPWFSAMAQGQALSAFVRLFEVTGEVRYRDAARATFASFSNLKAPGVPWVVEIDSDGHLWFEEYAKSPGPDRTLNGHIFAIFGLYDYYRLTSDPQARLLFQGGVTAVEAHLAQIRRPGWISWYCLSHRWPSPKYHAVHVDQLTMLYNMTGVPRLARWADRFLADYPAAHGADDAYLAAGVHYGRVFDSSGRVTQRRTFRLAAAEAATIAERAKITRRPGIWLRVSGGRLAGFWVRERAGRAFVKGAIERYAYDRPRLLTFRKGRYTGYRFDGRGVAVARRTAVLPTASAAHASARARVNGRRYVLVADGLWAGYWVPLQPGLAL